jgi:hypothetical protein
VEQPKVTRSEVRRRRWLDNDKNHCTTSDVWLGALSWCGNCFPCLPFVAPLPPNCIAQPLQNLHVEMTSNTMSMRCELAVHQTVHVKVPGTFWLFLVFQGNNASSLYNSVKIINYYLSPFRLIPGMYHD